MENETCSFESFNFSEKINAAITVASYTSPTPIQAKSIPPALEGKDILGLAQTGTGKTAAFVLPMLEQLLRGNVKNDYKKPVLRALVVVPTRELAEQVFETIRTLSQGTKIKAITIYGGVSFGTQLRNISHGTDIVVACPGRLLDHLQQRTINLKNVEILVLDEADHMFDMGFLPNVKNIVAALNKERQTMMFSATMPDPIRKLAMEILHNPVSIKADKGGPAKTVSHALYPVKQGLKAEMVLALLKSCEDGSVLIFARTKHRAAKLATKLEAAKYSTTCLQGNLSQNRRQEAIAGFRKGKYKIMVATDIAARGIDVSSVNHVINYDIPDSVEAYTHRIGRTGRAAQTGTALTLVAGEDESMVRSIERTIGTKIKRNTVEGFNYDAKIEKSDDRGSRNNRSFGDRPVRGARGRDDQRGDSRRPARRDDRRDDRQPSRNAGFRNDRPATGGDRQPRNDRAVTSDRSYNTREDRNQHFNDRFGGSTNRPARSESNASEAAENIGNNERGHNQSHLGLNDSPRPARGGFGGRSGGSGNGGNRFRRGSGQSSGQSSYRGSSDRGAGSFGGDNRGSGNGDSRGRFNDNRGGTGSRGRDDNRGGSTGGGRRRFSNRPSA